MPDNADFEGVTKGQVVDKIYSYILCLKKKNNGKKSYSEKEMFCLACNSLTQYASGEKLEKHCIVEI